MGQEQSVSVELSPSRFFRAVCV